MVTKIEFQESFADALFELIELEYDAVDAYESAVERIQDYYYKTQLEDFKEDHYRHIKQFSALLESHEYQHPTGPSEKQWLLKGKVIPAKLLGDETILKAMKSNKIDTNVAYERIQDREDVWKDARVLINQGMHDEKRHKAWLEEAIKNPHDEEIL